MADRELNNELDVRDAETDELTRPNRKTWIIALAVIVAAYRRRGSIDLAEDAAA